MARVLCFGEMLWDCLPRGSFPGGAPFNVAYHLNRLGHEAVPVSAVGNDARGAELLRRLRDWGIPTEGVAVVPDRPTGVVLAEIDALGNARYDIRENAAWDCISIPPKIREWAEKADAIVYGSLAQRSGANRESLHELMASAKTAQRIFDVNLRAPYDDLSTAEALGRAADLIKLNDEELGKMASGGQDAWEDRVRDYGRRMGGKSVCVTAGARGAGLGWKDRWYWEEAKPVSVVDTVGAGDAFLAQLIDGLLLRNEEPAAVLALACRRGEWVASREGATPEYLLEGRAASRP